MSGSTHHPSKSALILPPSARQSREFASTAFPLQLDPEKAEIVQEPTSASDWNGSDDPENPLNWPKWKRSWHIVPPALVSFAATFASSIYTPAFSEIKADFHVGSTVAILPLSLYVLALGGGPLLAAPISETYGRHIVYLFSAPLGALFTMGAGLSQNIASLCILRFFAGLMFSPALAIGAGTIADVNKPEHRATPTSFYILMPFLGPSLGPVVGSFVSVRKSWRWTQWTIIFFAIFSILTVLTVQETYKKTILLRRAKRLHLPPPPSPFSSSGAKIKFLITVTLIRPVNMLFTEPIVGFLSLYTAFNFSVLFSFFAAFPYVFRTVYDFSTIESGLVFFAIGIGCLLAVVTTLMCDKFLYQPQVTLSHAAGNNGVVPPEYRLFPAMFGSVGLPLGLFWFAWTAKAEIHWIVPVLAAIPFAWGNLAIFIAAAMYLVDTYQALAGASAMAANGLLRYTFGAVFPLFTLQMYAGMGVGWATSLLGFVTVALMPIPWVIFKWGRTVRARSAYDTLKA